MRWIRADNVRLTKSNRVHNRNSRSCFTGLRMIGAIGCLNMVWLRAMYNVCRHKEVAERLRRVGSSRGCEVEKVEAGSIGGGNPSNVPVGLCQSTFQKRTMLHSASENFILNMRKGNSTPRQFRMAESKDLLWIPPGKMSNLYYRSSLLRHFLRSSTTPKFSLKLFHSFTIHIFRYIFSFFLILIFCIQN